MKTKIMVLLAAIAVICCARSEPKKSDLDRLQGEWLGTEPNNAPDEHSVLKISAHNLDFVGADTNEWYKGTFTLNEEVTPKHFVGTIKACPSADCIGTTVYAIYKLESDTLTLAGSPPGETNFPANFEAPGARSIIFKRKAAH
jgi:uncharacterized protein (TIGR03067 family)